MLAYLTWPSNNYTLNYPVESVCIISVHVMILYTECTYTWKRAHRNREDGIIIMLQRSSNIVYRRDFLRLIRRVIFNAVCASVPIIILHIASTTVKRFEKKVVTMTVRSPNKYTRSWPYRNEWIMKINYLFLYIFKYLFAYVSPREQRNSVNFFYQPIRRVLRTCEII